MDKVLATKAYLRQQARKASDYFKPTENVRVRDFVREVPGAIGQLFSGTRDTFVKGGKILGEGAAYAMDRNVRDQYKAGNTEILPTISNTTPRQMLANTGKAGLELAPVGKMRGLATAAMSSKLAPRLAAGGALGYGYGVADEMSKPNPVNRDTFLGVNPVMSALAGALIGGASRPAAEGVAQSIREMGNDIRNINPKNRMRHEVVNQHQWEPVPGVFAPGGVQQMRQVPDTMTQSVKTTVDPFEPKSYLARVLMGKQSPIGNTIQAVDDPLLQEARKYKSAEEFVKAQGDTLYHGTPYKFDEFQNGRTTFFTPDKSFAEHYGSSKSAARGMDADVKILERYGKLNLFDSKNPEHIKKIEKLLPNDVEILGAMPGFGGKVPKKEFIERLQGTFTHDTPKFAKEAKKVGQVFDDMSIKHEGQWRIKEIKKNSVVAEKIDKWNNNKVWRTEEFPRSGTYKTTGEPYWKDFEGDKSFEEAVKKAGFDGYKMTERDKPTYGIFDTAKLKTKSQLTDLWKKATKK